MRSYLSVEIFDVHIQPAVRGGEAGVSDPDERSVVVLIGGHTDLTKHASVLCSDVKTARATVRTWDGDEDGDGDVGWG